MKPVAKVFLIGCGGLLVLCVAAAVVGGTWLATRPEGGVRAGNQMEQYALDYLSEHSLLEPGEEVLAYYDATLSMDGTEAAILTNDRVMYHKNGNTTSIALQDIEDVRHRKEPLIGDVIEIQAASGQLMQIEIAPLNKGETFKNVLMNVWRKRKDAPSDE